ncbi:hypothetical protein [Luteolibacter soli]|uniref:Uncharacterized protein n=1 Tax=Luteolibacter soli TaxID=3135280 RepID=A0ABU9AXL6_9BACT
MKFCVYALTIAAGGAAMGRDLNGLASRGSAGGAGDSEGNSTMV